MELRKISKEEYETVASDIKEEYKQNLEITNNNKVNKQEIDYEHHNFVNFTVYVDDMYGIIVDNKITGLLLFKNFMGGLSVDIYILPKYRNKNIAFAASNILVETLGKDFPKIEDFYFNIDPNNKKSMNLMKKLNWKIDYSFEELLINEGAEYFVVYTKKNPYYQKNMPNERGQSR